MRSLQGFCFVFFSACILALFAVPIQASTIVVDPNGTGDYTAIQPAIDAAQAGDTVLVRAGEYEITEPISFKGKAITVKSESGAEVTTIRMAETPTDPNVARVVVFESGETAATALEGFKLTGGYGGGVYCRSGSSPTLTNCTITENTGFVITCEKACLRSDVGGGIHCDDNSSPTLKNCTISENSGGGVFCEFSSPTLTNCTISRNSVVGEGGGVTCYNSFPNLKNCTISGNSGSGVYCSGSSPTLTNCIVWDNGGGSFSTNQNFAPEVSYSCIQRKEVWPGVGNIDLAPLFCGWSGPPEAFVDAAGQAPGDGSGEKPFRELAQALAYRLSLQGNSPCLGTGKEGANMGVDAGVCDGPGLNERVIHVAPGRYSIEGIVLAHGESILGSGEEETVLEGTVFGLRTGAKLSSVTVTGGQTGGILLSAGESPTVEDCTISGNLSNFGGGGVSSDSGSSPILTNCTISGNSAPQGYCGGVYCRRSSPTLTNCTITGNSALEDGGAYFEGGSPTMTNCTITGNSARLYCGGVYCYYSSPTLTNCTITGNSAGAGGGVFCRGSSPNLMNCTISGNSGIGVSCDNSSPTFTSCIVWDNEGGSISNAGSSTISYSCIDVADTWPDEGNINSDPLFILSGHWDDCIAGGQPGCNAYQYDQVTRAETAWHRWTPGDYHLQPDSPCIDAGTCNGAPPLDLDGNVRPAGAGCDMGAYEFGSSPPGPRFLRGDANSDGATDLSDAVAILGYLFLGDNKVPCEQAGDVNDDGTLDITDAVYVLSFLFLGGKAIKPPVGTCGIDPTPNELTCGSFPGCQ